MYSLFFRCLLRWCLLPLLVVSAPLAAETRILTSIKPLALIAQEVAGDRAQVDLLLHSRASAHDYSLRVSDALLLQDADLVLWVGPELETFLQRSLANRPVRTQIAVFHLPGIHWPSAQVREIVPAHDHHHHHGEDDRDPHLWLDPRNGVVIARALAQHLGVLEPESKEAFSARAEALAARLVELDLELGRRLKPVAERGFAVHHEGYMHFVDRYGLRQLGYVAYMPERRPGARHLYELRKTLKGQAVCLFVEPGYDSRSARDLAAELGLRLGVLDPMGGEQISTYNQLLSAMAEDFLACLTQG